MTIDLMETILTSVMNEKSLDAINLVDVLLNDNLIMEDEADD